MVAWCDDSEEGPGVRYPHHARPEKGGEHPSDGGGVRFSLDCKLRMENQFGI